MCANECHVIAKRTNLEIMKYKTRDLEKLQFSDKTIHVHVQAYLNSEIMMKIKNIRIFSSAVALKLI